MTFASRDKPWVRLLSLTLLVGGGHACEACDSRRRPEPRSLAQSRRDVADPRVRSSGGSPGNVERGGQSGSGQSRGDQSGSGQSGSGQSGSGQSGSGQSGSGQSGGDSGSMGAGEPAQGGTEPTVQSGGEGGRDPSEWTPLAKVRLVVLGDYGTASPREQRVAELVHLLAPDAVLTTGDNNYPEGSAATIDENIGQYFSDLIYPYQGKYASVAKQNRFFPVLGNHDWYSENAAAYLAYFTLPGNERYYEVTLGDVHFFALDSDEHEPDGVSSTSIQAQWLKRRLAASKSAFNVVAMHHPPYSSCLHGNTAYMQWPYAEWGADLVMAGHDHCYERLTIGGVTYIVSGLGGTSIYSFDEAVDGSVARYNEQYGVSQLEANADELRASFLSIDGRLIDSVVLPARRRP
jgi:tartrate-resistant acid phosphatase type 5